MTLEKYVTLELGTLTSHHRPSIMCRWANTRICDSYEANLIKPKPFDWPDLGSFFTCNHWECQFLGLLSKMSRHTWAINTSPKVSKYSRKYCSVVFQGRPRTIKSVHRSFVSMRFVFAVEFSRLSSLLRLFSRRNEPTVFFSLLYWRPQGKPNENQLLNILSFYWLLHYFYRF